MLRQGVYIDKNGTTYNTYEISMENFYRFDIMVEDGEFQLKPDDVLYSIIKKKKRTYIYGNTGLMDALNNFQDRLKFAKLPISDRVYWDEGKMCREQIKGNESDFFYKVVEKSGKTEEETFRDGTALFFNFTASAGSEMELIPFNMEEYQVADIGNGAPLDNSPFVSLEVLKSRFNLKHITERDYEVLDELERAKSHLHNHVIKAEDVLGFDFETSGLDMDLFGKDYVVGIVLSHKDGSSYYFPFAHKKFNNLPMEFFHEIIDEMQKYADKIDKFYGELEGQQEFIWDGFHKDENGNVHILGLGAHNAKFEHKVLRKYRRRLRIKHDSLQMDIAHNPRQGRGIHALKNVTEEIEGKKYLEFEDIFLDKNNINFADLPKDVVRYYACPDSDNLRKILYDRFGKLDKSSLFIYELESDLAEVKADQEFWGIRIDAEAYLKGYKIVKNTLKLLDEYIKIMAKWPDLKLTSNDSLAELLFSRMKCPVYVETKEGKASTGAAALKKLGKVKTETERSVVKADIKDAAGVPIIKASDLNNSQYPIILFIEKYREYSKLMTAFYARIEKSAVGFFFRNEETGDLEISRDSAGQPCLRYFFWINSNGAASGRQSSPAHQFPKSIKSYCLPDSSEHRFIGTDYSQIELRMFFSMAGEKEFIELCKDPDNDIHRIIGAIISKTEMWEISQEMRSNDKQRNFGVVYLMSGYGLATQKFGPGPSKAQVKDAQKSIDDLFNEFKRAKKFILDNKAFLLKNGYMETKLGRKRMFDVIFDKNAPKEKITSAIRQGNNTPVQGTAADIMKIAEVEMFKWILRKGWNELVKTPEGEYPKVRIVISAHDEALVSYHAPTVDVEEVLEMIKECMEMTFEGWAPLFGSSSVVDNWLEGKKDQYAIPIQLRDKLVDDYRKTGKSVMKTLNHKKEMEVIINAYRDESLISYMEDLIATNGLDRIKLASVVRHPTLTHDLISRFPQAKDHYQTHGKLSHIEAIQYAVDKYLEFRDNPDFDANKVDSCNESTSDKDVKDSIEDILGLTEKLYYYDDQGNEVYQDESEEFEQDYVSYLGEEDATSLDVTLNGGTLAVWELLDEFCFDFTGLYPAQCNEVLKQMYEDSKVDGFSRMSIIYSGTVKDTGMRCGKIDKDKYNKMIGDYLDSNSANNAS